MQCDYSSLPALSDLFLEESFVLGVHQAAGKITFDMDFVLLEPHACYEPPKRQEAYCFRRGTLTLLSDSEAVLEKSGLPPARDANGETDFGHIDTFTIADDVWYLSGDWGKIVQPSGTIEIGIENS